MKGLLKFLTVLVASFGLTSGCGLSGRGNRGGLGMLGRMLTQGSLGAVGAGGTTSTGGVLLGTLGGTLGSRLLGGGPSIPSSGLGTSGAISGLAAGVAALGTGLGSGNGGGLLGGIRRFAAGGQVGGASSGGCGPGSICAGSGGNQGQQLGQNLQVGAALARGFIVAGSAVRNSATSFGGRMGVNTVENLAGVATSQGGGRPTGGVPSVGSQPVSSGLGSVGSPGAQGAVHAAGTALGLLGTIGGLSAGGLPGGGPSGTTLPGPSNTGSGRNPVQGFGEGPQQISHAFGASSIATLSGSSTLATDLEGQPGGNPAANPTAGPSIFGGPGSGNGVSSVISGPASSVGVSGSNPGQGLGPGLPQIGQSFDRASIAAVGGGSTLTTDMGGPLGGNPAGTLLAVPASIGGGGSINSVSSVGSGTPSREAVSGTNQVPGLGQVTQQTRHAFGEASIAAVGGGSTSATGFGGRPSGNPAGNSLVDSASLGGGSSGNGVSSGRSGSASNAAISGAGLRGALATSTVRAVLGTVGADVLGGPGPSGGSAPGSSRLGSGIGNAGSGILQASNQMTGLGQSTPQSGHGTGATFVAASATSWHSAAAVEAQHPGTPTGNLPSGAASGSNGAATSGGIAPGLSGSALGGGLLRTVIQGTSGAVSLGAQGPPAAGPAQGLATGAQQIRHLVAGGTLLAGGAGRTLGAGLGTTLGGNAARNVMGMITGLAGASTTGTSSGVSVSSSSGASSGITKPGALHHPGKPGAGAAAGAAIAGVASALAISALGAGILSAAHSALHAGASGGGRASGGCSGRRSPCSSGGCGRKRRSIPQSKIPAEVLNSIPTNFERLF